MWKLQVEFLEDLKALMKEMSAALESIASAYPATELEHAKDSVRKLVKLIVEASEYVKSFAERGKTSSGYISKAIVRIENFVAAQFPKKLKGYRDELRNCRINFGEAALVDVLYKTHVMRE